MRFNTLCASLLALCCLLKPMVGSAAVTNNLRGGDGLRLPKPENWCIAQKTPIDCDLRDACVWCEKPGNNFGTGCYPISAAKLVPKSWGLVCDKELPGGATATAAVADACDGLPEAKCLQQHCVWCVSAAVPAACYTPEQAKRLPAAVFKCEAPVAAHAFGGADAQ